MALLKLAKCALLGEGGAGDSALTALVPADGKDKVRVLRVKRNADGTHDVREWIVCALVEG